MRIALVVVASLVTLLTISASCGGGGEPCTVEETPPFVNSSFEESTTTLPGVAHGWSRFRSNNELDSQAIFSLDRTRSTDGIQSQRINFTGATVSESSTLSVLQRSVFAPDAIVGDRWIFSIDLFAPTIEGIEVVVRLGWIDSRGRFIEGSDRIALIGPNTDFERFTVVGIAPPNTVTVAVRVVVESISSGDDLDLFMDNAQLNRIIPCDAATPALAAELR